MSAIDTAAEIGRGIYGGGLLVIGVGFLGALARFGRPALAAIVGLTQAITEASIAMRATAADAREAREATARIEATTERIDASVNAVALVVAGIKGAIDGWNGAPHVPHPPAGKRASRAE